ncbi:hypothetical protein MSG28_007710 [Choristoneura fumiferana]|uniref:Uncharacterized protein n=1 Tax=Choristoneura fumiferana TaxID=7141 RepID=A0ACC0JYT2_CHOFU|nr:hypothetical protein MSG28_007710 [Choristoneura fumiferana]
MVTKHLIIAVFLLGTAWAQLEKDPDLQNALNNIPPELEGKVTKEQFEEVQNKSAALFKDKCMRNGGANAFGNAEKAFLGLKSCVEGLVNRTELAKEIEEAKPVGKIDEEKECNQFSALQSCVVGKLESCAQPTTANIVEALFKYIRKGTPCKNFNEPSNQKSKPGSASGLAVTSLTLIMAAASLLIF